MPIHHKKHTRRRRIKFLQGHAKTADIVLQEMHGDKTKLLSSLRVTRNTHIVKCSFVKKDPKLTHKSQSDAGGIIALFRRSNFEHDTIEKTVYAAARIVRWAHKANDAETAIYSVHNFGADVNKIIKEKKLENDMQLDAHMSETLPHSHVTCVAGDFNAYERGEYRISTMDPEATLPLNRSKRKSDKICSITKQGYTEHWQTHPTHYSPHNAWPARLDRIYISLQPQGLDNFFIEAGAISTPDKMHYKKLSDHCPAFAVLRLKQPRSRESYPIASWVTKHRTYPTTIQKHIDDENLDQLSRPDAMEMLQKCARKAATQVRDSLLKLASRIEAKRQTLMTIARIISHDLISLYRKISHTSKLFNEHIKYENDLISIRDQKAFANEIRLTNEKVFEERARIAPSPRTLSETALAAKRRQEKANHIKLMLQRWACFVRQITLNGIVLEDGQTISCASLVTKCIAQYWIPQFAHRLIDNKIADELLNDCPIKLDFSNTSFPEAPQLKRYIRDLPDSGTGADGIPYSGYRNEQACQIIINHFR